MQDSIKRRNKRRENIRRKKRLKLAVITAAVLIVAVIVAAAVLIANAAKGPGTQSAENTSIGPPVPTDDSTIAPLILDYDYAKPVPQSAEAADSYFDNALFVGDARLQAFELYSILPGADILAGSAVNVSNAMTYEFGFKGGVTTLGGLLASRSYSSVYITMGLNELGWESTDAFIQSYAVLIGEIQRLQKDAVIYLHLIVPVSSSPKGIPSYITNERIETYNALIRGKAAETKVYYLDLSEVLCDENGTLSSGYTSNGIHFNQNGVTAWYEYLKTHIVEKELYRN